MKHYWKGLTITLAALVLAACGTPSSSSEDSSTSALTSITISGANDVSIEFDVDFNFLTGVTATGNNGTSYTEDLTLSSISLAVNTTTGELDTTRTGVHTVQYRVQVGVLVATKFRNVTVGQPQSTGGMLVNPDFALGTAGWDDPSVVYIADGAAMTLSTEAGELKAVVTAGANFFTPRFGQMNVPFVLGKTYEVSFDARSSVNKQIALQVGELLAGPPYFTDFLPSIENTFYRNITTTMQTFSYQFTMTQDNPRGGILFGLGRVNNASVNATMYFDNIEIIEVEPSEDTSPPIFSGVQPSLTVTVGSTYDPLAGITAADVVDGDVTADIVVVVKNAQDTIVSAVDTSMAGIFTVEYSVEDSKGNEANAETAVTVVDLLFKDENLFTNGTFATAIGEEWSFWTRDWAPAPVVNRTQNLAAGTYSLDIAGGGDASWNIQMNHAGAQLVEGQTYRLSFTGFASVARSFSAAFENPAPNNVNYGRKNGFEFGTTSSTADFVFTVTQPTEIVRLTIELGAQAGFADGVVTFEEVRLQRLDQGSLIANNDFSNSGWRGFANTWEGTAYTTEVVNGEFKMTVTADNGYESWHLQIVQDAESKAGLPGTSAFLDLAPSTTYELKFDAYASEAVTITPNIFGQNIWTNFVQSPATTLTTSKTTYTLAVVTGATLNDTEKLAFEFGTGLTITNNIPVLVYLDNITLKTNGSDVPTLYNGNMETALGGHTYFNTPGGTAQVTPEGLSIVTGNLGGDAYTPHYYYIFPTLAKGKYEVKIALTSSVTRDLRFNIILPDAGYASILPDNFVDFRVTADAPYVFTVSFEVMTPLTNVRLELDLGTLGGDKLSLPGTFLISEVLVYANYNS